MPRLTATQQRQVLEIALLDESTYGRKAARKVFVVFDKDGYGVRGYVHALEHLLKIVKRTSAAIAALEEGDVQEAQT